MSSTPHDHDHDHDHDAEPVTDRVHETSWSPNLEKPEHGEDRDLVVRRAVDAVEHTASGTHVTLVTHESHGQPSEYPYAELDGEFAGEDIDWGYVDQCGCGGHVLRVHV